MFRFLFCCCLLAAFSFTLPAQEVNFDQVVAPAEMRPRDFEAYLVQLAWLNQPANRILELDKQIAEKEVLVRSRKWMDNVQAGFNLNEISYYNIVNRRRLAESGADNTFVAFPLYSFNASISLGSFVNNPKRTDIARLEVEQATATVNQQKLAVRREVLTAYTDYLAMLRMLESRTLMFDDLAAAYVLAEQQFKSDKIEFAEFSRASERYRLAEEQKILAEAELRNLIYRLEELIGIEWEMAENYRRRLEAGGK